MIRRIGLTTRRHTALAIAATLFALSAPATLDAQAAGSGGTIRGRITDAESKAPLSGINVVVAGARTAVTDDSGRYVLSGIAAGAQTVTFRRVGFAPRDEAVTLTNGASRTLDVALDRNPALLGMVHVTGVSRVPERVVDAPAAIDVVDAARITDLAPSGQVAMMLGDLPGVHLTQTSLFDFNVNTHGFNGSTNRRLLVLIDGRDVAVPLLGNQDWADMKVSEPGTSVELVRGPGSALYGQNAFSGVLAINTPAVRQTRGLRLTAGGGQLNGSNMDGRYSWISDDYRWGFRLTGGAQQSDGFDMSRTNVGDMANEYAAAGIAKGSFAAPAPGYELAPLPGQTKAGAFGLPGAATGSLDPAQTSYGSARFDYYPANGSIVTAEGGSARDQNLVIPNVGGRSITKQATHPWARLGWTSDDFSLMAYYTGRDGVNFSTASASTAEDHSSTLHFEGQINRHFDGSRGRVVLGASARTVSVDSKGTILDPAQDGRSDHFYGVFEQVDYEFMPKWTAIVASRLDEGSLHQAQFSPKLGIVFEPVRDQKIRLTWNRGYLTPSTLERFIKFPAGAPLNLTPLEFGMRASPLGPALAGVPVGTLFTNSASVPVLAIGNADLKPEVVTGYELGWKAQIGDWFVGADAFYSELKDFNTGILTGVNPAFGPWTAPAAVPQSARAAVEAAANGAVGTGLSRNTDGSTAYILSTGNSGTAKEYGLEFEVGARLTRSIHVDANYGWYNFDLDQSAFAKGDTIRANTPPNTANLSASWTGTDGTRVRLGWRFEDAYHYRLGVWNGPLPSAHSLDVNVTYPLRRDLDITLAGTDVLDEKRVHLFGGSVIGSRVLASMTWHP